MQRALPGGTCWGLLHAHAAAHLLEKLGDGLARGRLCTLDDVEVDVGAQQVGHEQDLGAPRPAHREERVGTERLEGGDRAGAQQPRRDLCEQPGGRSRHGHGHVHACSM